MLYLGIDQHKRQLTVNLRGEDGSVVLKRQVSTEWQRKHWPMARGSSTSGPVYDSMAVEDGKIRLRFKHLGGGLVAKGGEPLKQFAIAGEDREGGAQALRRAGGLPEAGFVQYGTHGVCLLGDGRNGYEKRSRRGLSQFSCQRKWDCPFFRWKCPHLPQKSRQAHRRGVGATSGDRTPCPSNCRLLARRACCTSGSPSAPILAKRSLPLAKW